MSEKRYCWRMCDHRYCGAYHDGDVPLRHDEVSDRLNTQHERLERAREELEAVLQSGLPTEGRVDGKLTPCRVVVLFDRDVERINTLLAELEAPDADE